jgi:hypothetical protein
MHKEGTSRKRTQMGLTTSTTTDSGFPLVRTLLKHNVTGMLDYEEFKRLQGTEPAQSPTVVPIMPKRTLADAVEEHGNETKSWSVTFVSSCQIRSLL